MKYSEEKMIFNFFDKVKIKDTEKTANILGEYMEAYGYIQGLQLLKSIENSEDLEVKKNYQWAVAKNVFQKGCMSLTHPVSQKVFNDVITYGWHLMGVFASVEEKKPGFTYSIGLWHNHSHPELIVFGLPYEVAGVILNDLGDRIAKGEKLEINQNYWEVVRDYPVQFGETSNEIAKEYLVYADWFYSRKPFPSLQLIWTDKQSRFPWEPEFDEKYSIAQPLLLG